MVNKSLLFEKFKGIVGPQNITDKEAVMDAYTATALGRRDRAGALVEKPKRPDFVARPRNTKEIQEIVRLSNEHKFPVIPMGSLTSEYAEAVPLEGGIMLDMSKMNCIELDEELMHVTIEPGVTWAQAYRELASKGYWVSNQALPADISIMGTTTQGGPHVPLDKLGVPYSSYYSDLTIGMEIVLPTGELLVTGSAALPGARPERARAYGPDVGHIFLGAQGTLGIVVKQTLPLWRVPEARLVVTGIFKDKDFKGLVKADHRIVNDILQGPIWTEKVWARFNGKTQEWEFFVVLLGRKEFAEFNRNFVEEIIREEGGIIREESPMLQLETDYSGAPLGMAYEEAIFWRPRANSIITPSPDLQVVTIIAGGPYNRIPELHDAALKVLGKHGVPLRRVMFGAFQHRSATTQTFGLAYEYNLNDAEEVKRAKAVVDEWREFLKTGPTAHYRLSPVDTKAVMPKLGEYYRILVKLKRTLDPNRIMNPGKFMDIEPY
jgi:FAD/FMN-containing dehydrogenase